MAILVDTSALYALADAASPMHRAVLDVIQESTDILVLPVTVLPEADYLIADRFGVRVELALLRDVVGGAFRLEAVGLDDLQRCVELIEKYADSDIGFTDASIVAVAERLRITRILTLDHRRFSLFAPRHCAAFELLP